jgi:metal-responsive CopG/Arc/MetJ family transcriptional regulator
MKLKTSITLSEDIVKTIDEVSRAGESRSQTIERVLREGLSAAARRAADRRELQLINDHAAELNAEAADVLSYQGEV